jgi:hypothetical protein
MTKSRFPVDDHPDCYQGGLRVSVTTTTTPEERLRRTGLGVSRR